MNIFYLNKNLKQCAKEHCQKHIIKQSLEHCQLLSAAFPKELYTEGKIYKHTHINHPSSIWTRASINNFNHLLELTNYLFDEYSNCFNREHNSKIVLDFCNNNKPNLPNIPLTVPPQCMPNYLKQDDTIEAYRDYYLYEKSYFATWKNRQIPNWYTDRYNKLYPTLNYTAISSITLNNIIGRGNQLIFFNKEDMKHFKNTTTGSTIIMGSKTFKSIGKPLPNRINVVLSTKMKPQENVLVYNNIKDIMINHPTGFIIGGAEIYKLFLPFTKKLILSEFKIKIPKIKDDAIFPSYHNNYHLDNCIDKGDFLIKYYEKN